MLAEIQGRLNEAGYVLTETNHDLRFVKDGLGSIKIKVYPDWIEVSGGDYPTFDGVGRRPRETYRLSLKPRTVGKRIVDQIVTPHEEVYKVALARKMFEMSMDDLVAETKEALGDLGKKISIRWSDNLHRGEVRFTIGLEREAYGGLSIDEWATAAEVLQKYLKK
jgi:hypothetical protein